MKNFLKISRKGHSPISRPSSCGEEDTLSPHFTSFGTFGVSILAHSVFGVCRPLIFFIIRPLAPRRHYATTPATNCAKLITENEDSSVTCKTPSIPRGKRIVRSTDGSCHSVTMGLYGVELSDCRRAYTWRRQYIHCRPEDLRKWTLVWSRQESRGQRRSTAGWRSHRTSVCKT